MPKRRVRALLLSAALALATGAAPAARGDAGRRAGQGLPDQPAARRRAARRCAASTRACRRRAPTAGRRSAPAVERRRRQRVRDLREQALVAARRAQRQPRGLRQRPDQGGAGGGAQHHRRRPRRPEGRRAAGALQRGAGLCRRAPRPGVRAPRRQRRRAPAGDAARHREPLRGRRGDPHRRQPEPVPPRRVALDAGGRGGAARDLARGLPRRRGHAAGQPRAAAAAAAAAGDRSPRRPRSRCSATR